MNRTRLIALALLLSAAGLLSLSCDNDKDIPPLPPAPVSPGWLEIVSVTDSSATLRWQNIPDNELGFIIYIRPDTVWAAHDTAATDVREATVYDLLPDHTYGFRVTAYNEYGESAPTNEREAHTVTPELPRPPIDVEAIPQSATSVLLTWTNRDHPDNLLISRREPTTEWATLDTTVGTAVQYTDSTTTAQTTYFYRIGALLAPFVVWSDSVETRTPVVGVPIPPDQLQAEVILGLGVVITWRDRSADATRFDISRAILGQFPDSIASVEANTTMFTDSLVVPGHYYYRVRAANDYGVSAWSAAVEASYRFCSDGVVPICLDNFWEYDVDSASTPSSLRRYIADFEFIGGEDYYLIAQSPLFG
ncbi:MAG: fibronectin type III domain-containing protein, partial [bacterium]|nr:fibronectin type III domain-containing protein [bacterium]